jgi:hypothetical protein
LFKGGRFVTPQNFQKTIKTLFFQFPKIGTNKNFS